MFDALIKENLNERCNKNRGWDKKYVTIDDSEVNTESSETEKDMRTYEMKNVKIGAVNKDGE